jgi:hypothetical protein
MMLWTKGLYEKILEVHACILFVHPFTAVWNFWFGRIVEPSRALE